MCFTQPNVFFVGLLNCCLVLEPESFGVHLNTYVDILNWLVVAGKVFYLLILLIGCCCYNRPCHLSSSFITSMDGP